jgi:hypothetical protein
MKYYDTVLTILLFYDLNEQQQNYIISNKKKFDLKFSEFNNYKIILRRLYYNI